MQGQRQVSAGEAGLRCGGGGGPETLALRSGGGGRGPEVGAVGRVAAGSGAAGDRPGSCRQSWEGRLARDSDGGRPGGPVGCPAAALGTATGGRCVRGFLKRSERPGSASGGRPGASGPGVGETRGYRGFSVLWEPRGPRELGVAPVGERWEVGRPRAAGVRGDRERRKGTEYGASPRRRAAVGGGRVCGVETLNELLRGGTAAPCPPPRSGTEVGTQDPRRKGFEPQELGFE